MIDALGNNHDNYLCDRPKYQNIDRNWGICIVTKDDIVHAKLITKFNTKMEDTVNFYAFGEVYYGKANSLTEALKGIPFKEHKFDTKSNWVDQLEKWGYKVHEVL